MQGAGRGSAPAVPPVLRGPAGLWNLGILGGQKLPSLLEDP